jgi:hypothetical protein
LISHHALSALIRNQQVASSILAGGSMYLIEATWFRPVCVSGNLEIPLTTTL